MSADTTGDASGDGRWMTYADIAKLRGISKASAERLVFRRHWRRQQGNDRVLRVLVPLEFLSGDASGDMSGDSSADQSGRLLGDANGAWAGALANLEKVATVLREQLDKANQQAHEANKRADVAVALADRTLGQLLEAERRADRAEAGRDGERARADALRDRLETAQAEARQAQEAAEALRQDLEAAQVAQAEAEADAVELRERHAREIAAAEHDAMAAQQAAAELRLAADERKGRGRWARLRAAWRGE